ncbi:MAG TPA: hypothetical protein VF816_14410 [Rhodocyclaceae bacterium]
MTKDLGYGPRLSVEEFEKAIVALYAGQPADPGRLAALEIRRRELDLMIDHRLGRDYPQRRRDELWEIQRQVERRRWRLVFGWLWHAVSYRPLHRQANRLANYLVEEYAKVLSPEELRAYFDLREGDKPGLPLDSPR